jgi:protein-disulfide isomerase
MASSSLRSNLLGCGVCVLLISAGCASAPGKTKNDTRTTQPAQVASAETIVQFVRDRFEVPENVKLTADPLDKSEFPMFLQTVVTSDDGKQKHTNNVFVTKDGRCLVVGNLFALHDGSAADLLRCLREAAKIPPQSEVKISAFDKTAFPEFLKFVVTANDGKKTQSGDVFVTKDRRTGILGVVLPFREDLVRSMINIKDMPSQGPANAPVTVVEYADLECPVCARLQEFLEKELLPTYGDKVRVIFKEFPIPGHEWSATAAVANECAYEINPSAFSVYRSLIFANQTSINASNIRERLLHLGEQAGVDAVKLATCIDSSTSLPRVEAGRREGSDLAVNRTPTSFVNGRIVVGLQTPSAWNKIIGDALLAKSR